MDLLQLRHQNLENKELVKKRIHEAAKYVPLERLYLSPSVVLLHARLEINLQKKNSGLS